MSNKRHSGIFTFTYTSTLSAPIGADQLMSLLAQSRENNQRDHITGLLILQDDQFMQFLEGEEAQVLACMNRILEDPRHYNITVLVEESLPHRLFAEWAMGFKLALPNDRRLVGRSAMLHEPNWTEPLLQSGSRSADLLLDFMAVGRRSDGAPRQPGAR